ncbi:DUF364 domain-containing protein [Halorubrum sp. CBA1229]|uniref:Rossmann-like domain-containing protein n=1 Tax=Halorubrum sp. CBA1229 TaxID=1853699 RepID=UPI000F3E1D05|nr:DUF364 domain-containing protein [Halorubrum sp. CBA1229]QKY17385.1 hypothetical protein Hrr1229_010995 [Halorubrum sp. CBA1229]
MSRERDRTDTDAEWPGPVLRATLDALRDRGALSEVSLGRVTVGDAVALVELAAGGERESRDGGRPAAGLAHLPEDASPTPPADVEGLLAPLRPGEGSSASAARALGARSLAVATLNACAAPLLGWRDGDPMALLDPSVETVATVGLFRPAFRKFDGVEVRVVERDPVDPATVSTPAGVSLRSFIPAEAAAAMEGADVVFVTGSTLVYGGIERYLDAAPASATVVVVGATASSLPDPLFDRGVDVVAGAAVDDPVRTRHAVAGGACGTDLHDRGVRKVYAARDAPATIDLQH